MRLWLRPTAIGVEMSYPLYAMLLALALWMHPASGQDLRIGLNFNINSIDPLFFNSVPNNLVRAHIYDQLVHIDGRGNLMPGLAESWAPIDDTTWEFRLREGVTFHDGTALTADDVAFSIDRADKVPNSSSSFAIFTRAITGVEVIGKLTLRIHTSETDAYVPRDLASIAIQARHAAAGRTTAEFNTGVAAIGTGPFRFVEWRPGAQITLTRNDAYWDREPDWARLTLRPLTTDATREVALMTGEVDCIQNVPSQDAERLAGEPGLRIVRDLPYGVIFLAMDQLQDNSPFVLEAGGGPMDRNPLKDQRVRLALSKAINRDAIVHRIMTDAAVPAGQMLPDGFFGVSTRIGPERFDPDGARLLLAQAGLPNGFRITLHGLSETRADVAQALAQMLSRIGVKTEVVAMPTSVFFTKSSRHEFSLALYASNSSEMQGALRGTLATNDPARGWGTFNYGGYSNPWLDTLLGRARMTADDTKRGGLLTEASETAMADVGAIPLYHPMPIWGMRKSLMLDASSRAHSLAANIHPVKQGE